MRCVTANGMELSGNNGLDVTETVDEGDIEIALNEIMSEVETAVEETFALESRSPSLQEFLRVHEKARVPKGMERVPHAKKCVSRSEEQPSLPLCCPTRSSIMRCRLTDADDTPSRNSSDQFRVTEERNVFHPATTRESSNHFDSTIREPSLSLVEALNEKYSDDNFGDFFNIFYSNSPVKKSPSGVLMVPPIVAINYLGVTCAGDTKQLAKICHRTTEMDLGNNLIGDWNEVVDIASCLARAEFLNVSSNPLQSSPRLRQPDIPLPRLKRLVVNQTGVTWPVVSQLLAMFPDLEELHLSINQLSEVDLPAAAHPVLSTLYINDNFFHNFSPICRLGYAFPNLRNLVMRKNPLRKLDFESSIIEEVFPRLKIINLVETNLESWETIDRLSEFPVLEEVRLQGISFLEESYEAKLRRNLCVAQLGKITRLNGSPVTAVEREAAERCFIRHYLDAEPRPRRYDELVAIHGQLARLAEIDLSPQVEVQLRVEFSGRVETRVVNVYQTVREFKQCMETVTSLPGPRVRAWYVEQDSYVGPQEMRYPKKQLYRYNMRNGDTVILEERTQTPTQEQQVKWKPNSLK